MFGKFSIITNYTINAFKVYAINRFPYKSYQLWRNAAIILSFTYLLQQRYWNAQIARIKSDKLKN